MNKRKALLLGSTGLIGNSLLKILAESDYYTEIISFVRKPTNHKFNTVNEIVVDYSELNTYVDYFEVTDVFCCLGTTIKKAKTKLEFKKVDVDYPIAAAELASKTGVRNFAVVSAIGASSKSSIFYNQMKGIMEEGIVNAGILNVFILRPSLLLGNRNEFRFGEKLSSIIMRPFMFMFCGGLKKYKPINAKSVALAMFNRAIESSSLVVEPEKPSVEILTYKEIRYYSKLNLFDRLK